MSPHSLPAALAVGALLLGIAAAAPGRAGDVHGRLELTDRGAFAEDDSLDAALGEQQRNDMIGDARLTWEPRWDRWDFSAHYELTADYGGGARLMRDQAAFFPAAPPATMFGLTGTIVDEGDALVTHKIDRLSLGYSTADVVVRVGRQALTWGAGTMFHPMDLVAPFAPDTVDTEYKPGVDMAYLQWLFADGSDVQAIAVPRPAKTGGPVSGEASSFALQYQTTIAGLGATWLFARDHGDWTGGLGLSGPLAGAVWNAEIIPTLEADGAARLSALANISRAVTLLRRNATLFAEYFHNGFGVTESGVAFDALPADLTDRLARGQVFNTSQNYLAGGMTLEWTPLLSLLPSLIINLDDGSLYGAAEADWSLSDNDILIVGAQVPVGPDGTEYGGLPISGGSAPFFAPATTVYIQLRHHF